MPIYEYQCRNCDKRFEVIQKTSEDPMKLCSNCNGPLEKMISRSAFHLKGSGWYATDFSNSGECKKPACAGPQPSKTCESSTQKAS